MKTTDLDKLTAIQKAGILANLETSAYSNGGDELVSFVNNFVNLSINNEFWSSQVNLHIKMFGVELDIPENTKPGHWPFYRA